MKENRAYNNGTEERRGKETREDTTSMLLLLLKVNWISYSCVSFLLLQDLSLTSVLLTLHGGQLAIQQHQLYQP